MRRYSQIRRSFFLTSRSFGLDPPAQTELLALIKELRTSGRAIVLTTHVLEFAVRSSDTVIALSSGDARFVDAALPDALERLRAVFEL